MPGTKKSTGTMNPTPNDGRPDPNPMGDHPRLARPIPPDPPPPSGVKDLKAKDRPGAGPPRQSGDKP